MSAKHAKAARAKARRYQNIVDWQARRAFRVPWYVRPFPRWRDRWVARWDWEHQAALRVTTKRVAHAIADGRL
jgi:hypothetical protein